MTFPTIHLNGTSASELSEGYFDAHNAIQKAIEAVQKASPNGRDYYPQGPHAFPLAQDEHVARLKALLEVDAQIIAIAEHIADLEVAK